MKKSIKVQACLFRIILGHFPVIIRPYELEQNNFFKVHLRFFTVIHYFSLTRYQ